MHSRVLTVQLKSGNIEEAIRIYTESVAPAAMQQPGCGGILLLVDRSRSKGISISLWDTTESMIAGEASGYLAEQIAKFGEMFSGPPVREQFEVVTYSSK